MLCDLSRKTSILVICILMIVSIFLCPTKILASPGMPLEAQLDMAKYVVIGKITKITKLPPTKLPVLRTGYANIAVSKVLKGSQTKNIGARCIIWVKPGNFGSQAIHTCAIGDSGIWIINPDGPLAPYSVLDYIPDSQKNDVINAFQLFDKRRWSKPVNGLRAWGEVIYKGMHQEPSIIFAVQNVSKAIVFVPHPSTSGFVSAEVKGNNTNYHCNLSSHNQSTYMYCYKVLPMGIVYLQDTNINIRREKLLPYGKYSVYLKCQNSNNIGVFRQSGTTTISSVKVWTGKLTAPSTKIIFKPDIHF